MEHNHIVKKAFTFILNAAAWIILIFALLVTILVFTSDRNNGVPNLLGYIPLTVESDSMKPAFSKNDLIISRDIDDIKDLNEGDVITFWTIIDGKRVKNTHRIIKVNEHDWNISYVTKGDNNPTEDSAAYIGYSGSDFPLLQLLKRDQPPSFFVILNLQCPLPPQHCLQDFSFKHAGRFQPAEDI